MERAYYIVRNSKLRDDAIKIDELQRKRKEDNYNRLKELSSEFGCDEKQYYSNRYGNITALVFTDKTKPIDKHLWKQVDNKTNGFMPKRNSAEGRKWYKEIVGNDVSKLDTNSVIPKGECFESRISGMHLYSPTCSVLPFSIFGKEDVVILSILYDEYKFEAPQGIPEDIDVILSSIKAHEMQKLYDEYNELATSNESKENNGNKNQAICTSVI
jgi:hypothetical protein